MSSTSKDGILAVCGTFLGLGTVAFGMRLMARRTQSMPLKADDAFALISLITHSAGAIIVFVLVHDHILGYKMYDVVVALGEAGTKRAMLLYQSFDVVVNSSLACTKLSILFFYLRSFSVRGSKRWIDWAVFGTVAVVVAWLVVIVFLSWFQCRTHEAALWGPDLEHQQYCTLSRPFLRFAAVSDFCLDIWILLLPLPCIVPLHTSRSKKLSIFGIFLLAFVGLGASMARIIVTYMLEKGGKDFWTHHDQGSATTEGLYLTMLEAGISLVASNLPSLWLLCSKTIPERVAGSLRSVVSLSSVRSERGIPLDGGESLVKGAHIEMHPMDAPTRIHSV